ncbi:MAG TPA: hypothetical protein VJT08_06160 [Terriglobales bacterium]|nr:hypothetical protein [Terriglobales bacterium]
MSPQQGTPAADPSLRRAAKWIALILFVLYCADLIWKLAHWNQYAADLAPWQLGTALTLRLVFMAFLLWMFVRARRAG